MDFTWIYHFKTELAQPVYLQTLPKQGVICRIGEGLRTPYNKQSCTEGGGGPPTRMHKHMATQSQV